MWIRTGGFFARIYFHKSYFYQYLIYFVFFSWFFLQLAVCESRSAYPNCSIFQIALFWHKRLNSWLNVYEEIKEFLHFSLHFSVYVVSTYIVWYPVKSVSVANSENRKKNCSRGNRENLSRKQFLPLIYSCHYFHTAQSRNENHDEKKIWAAEAPNWHSIYFVTLWNRNKSTLIVPSPKFESFLAISPVGRYCKFA